MRSFSISNLILEGNLVSLIVDVDLSLVGDDHALAEGRVVLLLQFHQLLLLQMKLLVKFGLGCGHVAHFQFAILCSLH